MHLFCNLNFFHTSILSQFVMLWLYDKLPFVCQQDGLDGVEGSGEVKKTNMILTVLLAITGSNDAKLQRVHGWAHQWAHDVSLQSFIW